MRAWAAAAVCGLTGVAGLAGCTGGAFAPAGSSASQSSGATLTGKVRGGQQPIVGAHVYLLAANTTGYGGNGIAASSSNASVSLLTSVPGSTTLDTTGGATNGDYYVTTDANGSWTITGDYTCTAGQQVYLYALGGDPGAGANAAAGLMAALGACPSGGSFASTTYVVINEVSTVATAYAFAGFATDATHVSNSGTALAQTGIANAFANVANLETLSTGVALATTPAGNGTVPQTEINTLANILASCVNTNGAGSTSCTTLFANATVDGTSTGAQPADTASAAINIAHHPGTNVAALYALAGGTPPFAPGLTRAPDGWSVFLIFTANWYTPTDMAIDKYGNAWVAQVDGGITELSSTGVVLSGTTGFTDGNQRGVVPIVFDPDGNLWVNNFYAGSISKFSPSGVPLSGTQGYVVGVGGVESDEFLAIDASDNIWVSNESGAYGSVYELSNTGANLSGASGYPLGRALGQYPGRLAVDGGSNVWVGYNGGQTKLSSTGTVLSTTDGVTGITALDSSGSVWAAASSYANLSHNASLTRIANSGSILFSVSSFDPSIFETDSINIDGEGNVWIAVESSLYSGLIEYSSSGALLSPANGYAWPLFEFPAGSAIDGSGDVWLISTGSDFYLNGTVAEMIGGATPAITPIVAGLPATPTTDGSSNLGTRP